MYRPMRVSASTKRTDTQRPVTKVVVIAVGRLKEAYLVAAEDEYKKRLRPYCTLNVVEVKDDAAALAAVPVGAVLYAFDERGVALTSLEFARETIAINELHGGGATIAFAIGGADGHSDAMRLVRVLVLEQIYRGYTINRGLPYHREG